VIGMTRALAAEFGPLGLNINALCPGATRTAINVHFRADPEVQRVWQQMTPLRMADGQYIADPRDLANAALYLASDESRFVAAALSRGDRRARVYRGDFGDPRGCESLVESVHADFGRIDILVNNAGIVRVRNTETTSRADWDDMIGVNLTAPFLLSQRAVPI